MNVEPFDTKGSLSGVLVGKVIVVVDTNYARQSGMPANLFR